MITVRVRSPEQLIAELNRFQRIVPEAVKRVEAVRKVRQESKSLPTKKLAATPTR